MTFSIDLTPVILTAIEEELLHIRQALQHHWPLSHTEVSSSLDWTSIHFLQLNRGREPMSGWDNLINPVLWLHIVGSVSLETSKNNSVENKSG